MLTLLLGMIHRLAIPTGSDAVNEHINQPIPECLWHYTSYGGAMGIVTSKAIWATEYRFLNDREEFAHAKKLALEVADEQPESSDGFNWRKHLQDAVIAAFNAGPLAPDQLCIMVASFSAAKDQLSQWRGYARNSTGVCIGLNLQNVRPPGESGTKFTFAKCIYDDQEKRAILRAVLDKWVDVVRVRSESLTTELVPQLIEAGTYREVLAAQGNYSRSVEIAHVLRERHLELQFDFLRIAPLLKNETFSEEREWRLVLPVKQFKPKDHPFEFRSTSDTLVPYIAYPLLRKGEPGPIPCNGLIIGPGGHPAAELAVRMLLEKHGIRVQVDVSKIPYRSVNS